MVRFTQYENTSTNTTNPAGRHPLKFNRRTIAMSAAALTTVGLLTACSTGTTPTATEPLAHQDAPSQSAPSTNGNIDAERAFVAAYENEFGSIDYQTTDSLIDLGYTVCDTFDAGFGFFEIAQMGIDEGIPEYEAGFIVGSAVGAFCPEYTQDVYDAAESAGVDTSGTNA